MAGSAKRDARKIVHAERQRKALELRKAGATYEQIAKQLGYAAKANAYRDIVAAIRAIIAEPATDVRSLELERLDTLLLGLWPKARTGDTQSIDRVLRVMERRAAFLGLDAPKHTELTGKDGAPLHGAALFLPQESDD